MANAGVDLWSVSITTLRANHVNVSQLLTLSDSPEVAFKVQGPLVEGTAG